MRKFISINKGVNYFWSLVEKRVSEGRRGKGNKNKRGNKGEKGKVNGD